VGWLRRTGPPAPGEAGDGEKREAAEASEVERSAPGIAALFSELREDGSHAVLDLGSATETNFELYSRYARRIRFADLLTAPLRGEPWEGALRSLSSRSGRPYDIVLAWNLFDLMPPPKRRPLVERLARLTAPGARLYVLVDSSGGHTTQPLRFAIRGMDRVAQRAVGGAHPAGPELLPAEVERLLRPFEVTHAFTLRLGYREYVGVRDPGDMSSFPT
jgi:hypothetical protein